jgi:4-diphosphocytidyl-2-C-methyl-D-erythritol kinase
LFKNTHNFTLSMLSFPNCKINLGLYVTRKRDDGYHDIETVFYPLPLNDVLEIVPSDQTDLHTSGLAVGGNVADNLVWKAYHLLLDKFPDKVQPVDIYLHKVIPMGAGLGGGSSDGASMLLLLNDDFKLGLDSRQLASFALQLGSDCPFFIKNVPQFAIGRGEIMTDISLNLSGYSIQLICPKVHVATGKAFAMLKPRPAGFDLRMAGNLAIEEWKDRISNDFEVPVFAQYPALAAIKRQLYEQGALYAAMSGSGSAIFGIFPKGIKAQVQADVAVESFYSE